MEIPPHEWNGDFEGLFEKWEADNCLIKEPLLLLSPIFAILFEFFHFHSPTKCELKEKIYST